MDAETKRRADLISSQILEARSRGMTLFLAEVGEDSYDLWLDHPLITEVYCIRGFFNPVFYTLLVGDNEARCSNFKVTLNILDGIFWAVCDAHYRSYCIKDKVVIH